MTKQTKASTRAFICKVQNGGVRIVEHCINTTQARKYCESFGYIVSSVERLLPEGARIVEVSSEKATTKTIRTVCEYAGVTYTYQQGKLELKKLLKEHNLFIRSGVWNTWLTGACDL